MRSWLFLFTLSLLIMYLGHSTGGRQGLLWGVILALSINSFIYFYSDIRLFNLFHGRPLEGQDPWGLLKKSELLAKKARIPKPRIIILNEGAPQAIVLGRNLRSGTILLTQGLIDALSPEELEGVLAYQMACIKQMNTLAFSVGSAITGFLLLLSNFMDRIIRWLIGAKSDPLSKQNHICSLMIAPLATLVVRLTIGSKSYFQTDALAASWIGDPKVLAQALWKLQSYSATRPLAIVPSAAPSCIVNPLTKKGWTRYFHVHPKVEKRIQRLVGYYPI